MQWSPPIQPAYSRPQTGLATAALVCGCASVIIPPAAIGGVVLGFIAMAQADREPQRYGGKGMAVAGAIIGGIIGLFWLLGLGLSGWDSPFWWDW